MEAQPEVVHNVPVLSFRGAKRGCLLLMQAAEALSLRSLDTYYSPLFGPVWSETDDGSVNWIEVVECIKSLPGSEVLRLQPLDAEGSFLAGIQAALLSRGYAVDRFFCFGNWYEHTEGLTFNSYWSKRPSRLRNTVERASRRLGQKHSWNVEILDAPGAALELAISTYQAVYKSSWKQAEPCPEFMPGLIRLAAGQGALRLGQLWLDGEVVASQVWLVFAGKASIYKLAYVPGHERLSVGSVLTAALMQHVIDLDKVNEMDYLMGDDAYKQDWMTLRRERVGLIAFNLHHWRGLLEWARHHVGRHVSRWLR